MIIRIPGLLRSLFILLCWSVAHLASATEWIANVDQQGLPTISRGGGSVLSSSFGFWGRKWAWADQLNTFKVVAPYEYYFKGKNQTLNFEMSGRGKKSTDRQITWEIDLNAQSASVDVIGGGIVFKFDPAAFAELGEPVLLAGNRGWAWGRSVSSRVEMRFDPPLASVYFEPQQNKSEIRAFFYKDEIPKGVRRLTATMTVAGEMVIGPSITEQFGLDDPSAWPANILDWKTSPVDLSFLNLPEKPAGKHGFLKARKDKLVFEDSASFRFWGTNLSAYTLFRTSKENVKQQARRLSELGFNLVRLAHHDSPWVDPNIFGDQNGPNTQNLSAAMLDKLDWWIKCLKDEGIYVWLDLHFYRQVKAGDGIDGFEEISKGKPPVADLWGYSYVNASIRQAMKRFSEIYVSHKNSYTGLTYKDEPAIIALMLTNENDVTFHFGNALLGDKGVPKHNALYMAEVDAYSTKYGLQKDRVWRAWEHGPSKLFLNDLEHRFDTEMIAHLRSLGVKVPLVTTSTWGHSPLSSLPALTTGDLIDAHEYGGTGELGKNPAYTPTMVNWLAAARIAGKPLSISEWNVESFPSPDRHTIPLYVASAASMQGWDALLHYAYAQQALDDQSTPSNWHAYNDPALMATIPAAALLYRQAHVSEASTVYAFVPGKDRLFNQEISPKNSIALRTAAERGKLMIVMPQTKELPWLEQGTPPAGAKVFSDPQQSFLAANAGEADSDSGELRRNWDKGTLTINTPRTQAAMGWIGGNKIALADISIAASTRNATVAVQSLDGKPISESDKILISFGARSVPESENKLPFRSEPVEAQLDIRARKGLTLQWANSKSSNQISSGNNGAKSAESGEQVPKPRSPALTRLASEIVAQEAKLRDLSGNLGPNHPTYLRVQSEIDRLKTEMAVEAQNSASATPERANANKQSGEAPVARSMASVSYRDGRYSIKLDRRQETYWLLLKR